MIKENSKIARKRSNVVKNGQKWQKIVKNDKNGKNGKTMVKNGQFLSIMVTKKSKMV